MRERDVRRPVPSRGVWGVTCGIDLECPGAVDGEVAIEGPSKGLRASRIGSYAGFKVVPSPSLRLWDFGTPWP